MNTAPIPDESPRSFWYGLINYEQRTPTTEDFKLDRMRKLLDLLGNPQKGLRCIHVAGSKGKGSTSAMLATVLNAAGYKTGLFTSPHLNQVEERIRIQGKDIPPAVLDELLQGIREVLGAASPAMAGFVPTFFEVATAAAFMFFAREKVDFAILETGLGGRLDSTNVCLPLATIITSISFDHEAQLGNTLEKIAWEKAGIIKPGVPVFTAVNQPEALRVIRDVAFSMNARVLAAPADISWTHIPGRFHNGTMEPSRITALTLGKLWPEFSLSLLGAHQAANAALVLACVQELEKQGVVIPLEAVREGLANTRWPGRMEVAGGSPLVVLDCAHNRASAAALIQTIRASFPNGPRTLLFGASADKDIAGMFREFEGIFDKVVFTQSLYSPRASKPAELAKSWLSQGQIQPQIESSLENALRIALNLTPKDGILCVTGSVFLVGEVRVILPQLLS